MGHVTFLAPQVFLLLPAGVSRMEGGLSWTYQRRGAIPSQAFHPVL